MKHNSSNFWPYLWLCLWQLHRYRECMRKIRMQPVEDTLSENKQDNDEAGQTESSVTTDTSQEVTKEAGKNQVAVEKVQNTQGRRNRPTDGTNRRR